MRNQAGDPRCFDELGDGDYGSVLKERKRRIGENEALFRNVNQRVRPLDGDWMTILCECGNLGCRDQLVISRDEYARVRDDPTAFILRPGHDVHDTEQVLSKHIEYWIVQKLPGVPARVARASASNM